MKTVLVPSSVLSDLIALRPELTRQLDLVPYDEDSAPPENVNDIQGIFRWVAGKRYASLVEQIPSITWLHTASAGVDHVLSPTVKSRTGMIVTDSGPAFGPAISEFVLAAILSVARRLPAIRENQRNHFWRQIDQRELYGSTIGIIGLGPIGTAIAKRAKAFDMKVIGLRRTLSSADFVDDVVVGADGLTRILTESDYIVLAAALTEETKHLIGRAELAKVKPDTWLVNIARGGLVDETALVEALKANAIGGAILDVFEKEPLPMESLLWDMPNVVVSPHHSGGGTEGLRKRQLGIFADNALNFAATKPLNNVVEIDRGY